MRTRGVKQDQECAEDVYEGFQSSKSVNRLAGGSRGSWTGQDLWEGPEVQWLWLSTTRLQVTSSTPGVLEFSKVWFTFKHKHYQAVAYSRIPGRDLGNPKLDKISDLCRAPVMVQVVLRCVKSLARYYTRVVECWWGKALLVCTELELDPGAGPGFGVWPGAGGYVLKACMALMVLGIISGTSSGALLSARV